jgi:hypothetical protein
MQFATAPRSSGDVCNVQLLERNRSLSDALPVCVCTRPPNQTDVGLVLPSTCFVRAGDLLDGALPSRTRRNSVSLNRAGSRITTEPVLFGEDEQHGKETSKTNSA